MVDDDFIHGISEKCGLSFEACEELLGSGWTFVQNDKEVSRWEAPLAKLEKQEIPLTLNFREKIGTIDKVEQTDEGFMVTGTIDAKHAHLVGGSGFTGFIPKDI